MMKTKDLPRILRVGVPNKLITCLYIYHIPFVKDRSVDELLVDVFPMGMDLPEQTNSDIATETFCC